ncbi:MAG: DnaJ domain-containing protein [Burkholderiales bacterium]|nr:DnaJ domain-containing protein [Burkholderiales bacterium]
MKRTLYEFLELKPEATQAEIDAAYAAVRARLQPGIDRADTDALNLSRLLKDGYRILSDPERRAGYDATIRAQWKLERSQIITIETLPAAAPGPGPARKPAQR